MSRGYQHDFSSLHGDSMYDKEARERKANTMIRVLSHNFGEENIAQMSLLDVGSSTGIIDNYLSRAFAEVTGIDIDTRAVEHAKKAFANESLHFCTGDAMSLDFPENSFDVVICSQIYEHVPDARQMMDQIFRVLKPEGVCYFAAGNRLSIEEHHYKLPFLSVIPRPLGHLYLRMTGKGTYYYEKHLSYWGLQSLVASFDIIDYTGKVINDPEGFDVAYMLEPGSRKQKLAQFIVQRLYWLCPGYIWLLKKPGKEN
jgi:2-polyprenyl-3-methyl-5-hydroxy-6-metoxy-1,4-benzoquinol methylase